MNIDSIKNGFVIDHIQAGKGMEIYEKLNLNNLDCQVAIITNAKSKKTGKKDIIKIDENININIDTLGFIDPNINSESTLFLSHPKLTIPTLYFFKIISS